MKNDTVTAPDIKSKHRAMWALGDYAAVAADVVPGLGPVLVEASGLRENDYVLDVAAGSGNAAIPAARAGARVVASDLTPQLLASGRQLADGLGLSLEWREADAENLPFPDGAFDVVLSCVGVMFTPDHQRTADELIRVARAGGTIGLLNWTPDGFIGQMFAVMKPYAAPAPAGSQPPSLWGSGEYVAKLFGDRVTDVVASKRKLIVDLFDSPEAFREYYKSNYGPTIAVFRNIAGDAERVADLDRELVELARRFGIGGGAMEWEYLLYVARTR